VPERQSNNKRQLPIYQYDRDFRESQIIAPKQTPTVRGPPPSHLSTQSSGLYKEKCGWGIKPWELGVSGRRDPETLKTRNYGPSRSRIGEYLRRYNRDAWSHCGTSVWSAIGSSTAAEWAEGSGGSTLEMSPLGSLANWAQGYLPQVPLGLLGTGYREHLQVTRRGQ
jgi:hypothetical protein